MKKGIHPETYRLVAFKDMSNEDVFITRSCATSKETITIDGVEYPLVKLEISNTSHPFYTGKMKCSIRDTSPARNSFLQGETPRRNRNQPRLLLLFYSESVIISAGIFNLEKANIFFPRSFSEAPI